MIYHCSYVLEVVILISITYSLREKWYYFDMFRLCTYAYLQLYKSYHLKNNDFFPLSFYFLMICFVQNVKLGVVGLGVTPFHRIIYVAMCGTCITYHVILTL